MRDQHRQPRQRRLRKQPKMRRMQVASTISRPKMSVPQTAQQRRRRNSRRVRLPAGVVKRFVFSARWISLAILSLSVYALVLVGIDEHFYLTIIPVEGALSIPAAEVVEASGLGSVHVFAADPNLAASRIAELPGVVAAWVTLKWPNQVAIEIEEDSPVAVWQEGFNQYWITKKGNLIRARNGTSGLLLIESEISPEVGEEPANGSQASLAFVPQDVLDGALMLRRLRPNIDKLYYGLSNGLSYEDGRGWRVYFGTGTDMHQKLVVYESVVSDLLARELVPSYISVSNQEKPFYMAQ